MSEETGIVRLEDLPEKEVFVSLKEDFHKSLEKGIRNFGVREFSKRIKSGERIILHWLTDGSSLRLDVFKRILNFFDCNIKTENIKFLRGKKGYKIYNPKLPFDFTTTSGVRIITALLGDGCLAKSYRVFYANMNKDLIAGFIDDIKNVFGEIEFDLREKSDNKKVKIICLPPLCGKIVSKTGLKKGRKVSINPTIPDFIFKLNEKFIWTFLSQVIDDEGSINLKSKYVKIKFALEKKYEKSSLLEGIKKLLSKLEIEAAIYQGDEYNSSRGENRKNWVLQINRSLQIKKMYHHLSLRHRDKNEKFHKLVNSYKLTTYPMKESTQIYLAKMKLIERERGYFTSNELSNHVNRKVGHVRNMIRKYFCDGVVQRIEESEHKEGKFCPAKYRVVK